MSGEDDGWGPMGGGTGDGIGQQQQQQQQQPYAPAPATPPPMPQQQQQQPQYSGGSITRFASPEMNPNQQMSYTERSQQYGGNQPPSYDTPQQQQQQQSYYPSSSQPSSTGYNTQQQQQPQMYGSSSYNAAATSSSNTNYQPGSYAARSQQAHGSNQQSAGGSNYGQQQQQYGQQQQQPQQNNYNQYGQQQQPQNMPYGQQQQQQPQQQTYGQGQQSNYGQQQSTMSATSSISNYGQQQQQPGGSGYGQSKMYGGPQQQQQQPTPGSYAARSAATLYGQQQASPQQQQQQQPGGGMMPSNSMQRGGMPPQQQGMPAGGSMPYGAQQQQQQRPVGAPPVMGIESQQQQQRFLTESTRKIQEHTYYMKQAMDQNSLPVVLDRAAHMVGELGGPPHGQQNVTQNTGHSAKLTPKNYYELYMRALEEMPAFEEYLLNLTIAKSQQDQQQNQQQIPGMIRIVGDNSTLQQQQQTPQYTMRQLYDCVQYCPRVVSRLYLQIAAGSALIRSKECGAKWVMQDLQQAIKCEQNPVRGLFLRNFLLTALRDKLPDTPPPHKGKPNLETIESNNEEDNGESNGKDDDDDSAAHYEEQINARKATNEHDIGTVKDSYEFILSNFMEMNKLWVRIQNLPGEGKNKDVRKRRERERNDLRILVGTNLVRLSQLECITSKIYGEIILSQILEHIVTTGDPLSQAYLMDCLVQVFPDEYHIETLPILLNVCPRLRDKVNIRTILQGLMDRLANYLADEELLDEDDTNQVKKALARDSFSLFEDCVQKVYNSRGPKLTSKEVIRLQTALLQFSIKCYPGHMEQVASCINKCVTALRQANASYEASDTSGNAPNAIKPLDEASVAELEKLLSIPLDTLALRVFELEQYSNLISFLPWVNRREVAVKMLKAVENAESTPKSVSEIEQLFNVIEPLVCDDPLYRQAVYNGQNAYIDMNKVQEENNQVSKLVQLLDHNDTDTLYDMLKVAKQHICNDIKSGPHRMGKTLISVVFACLRLARRVFDTEQAATKGKKNTADETTPNGGGGNEKSDKDVDATKEGATKADEATESDKKHEENITSNETKENEEKEQTQTTLSSKEQLAALTGSVVEKSTSCRAIFVFVQETISALAKCSPETAIRLYIDASLTADVFASNAGDGKEESDYAPISYELLTQAFALYDEHISESKAQYRCIQLLSGCLLQLKSLGANDYETLITKTAQYAAKVLKKPDQCQLISLCAHLFYPCGAERSMNYSNAQRSLECLQRALKLADACTSMSSSHVGLFVELLEHYVYFYEKKNPLVTPAYISGLVALIKEHLNNVSALGSDADAKAHFLEVVRHIKQRKEEESFAEMFAAVQIGE